MNSFRSFSRVWTAQRAGHRDCTGYVNEPFQNQCGAIFAPIGISSLFGASLRRRRRMPRVPFFRRSSLLGRIAFVPLNQTIEVPIDGSAGGARPAALLIRCFARRTRKENVGGLC
jgi:hypothetical protein